MKAKNSKKIMTSQCFLMSLATLLVLNSCTQPSKYVGVWYCGAAHYTNREGDWLGEYGNSISVINLQPSGEFVIQGDRWGFKGTWKEDVQGIQLKYKTLITLSDGKVQDYVTSNYLGIDSLRDQLVATHIDSEAYRSFTKTFNRVVPGIDPNLENHLYSASWEMQLPSDENRVVYFCKDNVIVLMSTNDSFPQLEDQYLWRIYASDQYQVIFPYRTMVGYPFLLLKGGTKDELPILFASSTLNPSREDLPLMDTCYYRERKSMLVKKKSLSDKEYVKMHQHLKHTRWDSKKINFKNGYYQVSLVLQADSIHLRLWGLYDHKEFDNQDNAQWHLHASGDLIYYKDSLDSRYSSDCNAFYINQLNPSVINITLHMNTQHYDIRKEYSGKRINVYNQNLYRVLY